MTKGTFRLGRIAGIPISANWTAVVGALIIATSIGGLLPPAADGPGGLGVFALSLAGALLFAGSLLAHELGHALVARRRGVHTQEITLWMLGGVAKLTSEPTEPKDELAISAAGPAVSLGFGAIGAGLALGLSALSAPEAIIALAWIVAFTNVMLGVFNLLPGLPLDGGRILRAWQWKRHGDRERATLTAARGGRIVGGALMLIGLWSFLSLGTGLWTMFVGFFLWSNARLETARIQWAIAKRNAESWINQAMPGFPNQQGPNQQGPGQTGPNPYGPRPWTPGPNGSGSVIDVDGWASTPGGPSNGASGEWPTQPGGYPTELSMWPTTSSTSAGRTS